MIARKEEHDHIIYYIVLGVVLFLGFMAAREKKEIFIVFPAIYAISAIIHHKAQHTLTGKVVVEYVLIAAIGTAVFFFLLLSGAI